MFKTPALFWASLDAQTRWNLRCETINAVCNGLLIGIAVPFVPLVAMRAGAGAHLVGLMLAALYLSNLFAPLWALIYRGKASRQWYGLATGLYRAILGAIGLLHNPVTMAVIYIGAHFVMAAGNPAYADLAHRIYPPELRGRLMSFVRSVLAGSMLLSTLVAGNLIDRVGLALPLLVCSVIGSAGAVVGALVRERPEVIKQPCNKHGVGPGGAFDPSFCWALGAIVLFHGAILMAQPAFVVHQVQRLELTSAQVGLLALIWNLTWMGGFAVWGKAADRNGGPAVLSWAAVLYLSGPLIYLAQPKGLALLLLASATQGMADAALDVGLWQTILCAPAHHIRPRAAVALMLTGLRGALAPVAGSSLIAALGPVNSLGWTVLPALLGLGLGLAATFAKRQGQVPTALVIPAEITVAARQTLDTDPSLSPSIVNV